MILWIFTKIELKKGRNFALLNGRRQFFIVSLTIIFQNRSNSMMNHDQHVRHEVIYAPVAELQQKINQRHQPVPMMSPNHSASSRGAEGEQYGFGVQFQQQTQFFHSHMHDQRLAEVYFLSTLTISWMSFWLGFHRRPATKSKIQTMFSFSTKIQHISNSLIRVMTALCR